MARKGRLPRQYRTASSLGRRDIAFPYSPVTILGRQGATAMTPPDQQRTQQVVNAAAILAAILFARRAYVRGPRRLGKPGPRLSFLAFLSGPFSGTVAALAFGVASPSPPFDGQSPHQKERK